MSNLLGILIAIGIASIILSEFRNTIKGWWGELIISITQKIFLDSDTYKPINNAIIPTSDGTTQIDHIIVSRYGIFVTETKNYKGWIFGDEHSPTWTQSIYGKKSKFQNPLRQNYKHTKALSEFLGIEHDKFFSIVIFVGDCTFKTPMPENVLKAGYISYIKSKQDIFFNDEQVEKIEKAIREGRIPSTWKNQREHVKSLNQRLDDAKACPRYDSSLKLRTAKASVKEESMKITLQVCAGILLAATIIAVARIIFAMSLLSSLGEIMHGIQKENPEKVAFTEATKLVAGTLQEPVNEYFQNQKKILEERQRQQEAAKQKELNQKREKERIEQEKAAQQAKEQEIFNVWYKTDPVCKSQNADWETLKICSNKYIVAKKYYNEHKGEIKSMMAVK